MGGLKISVHQSQPVNFSATSKLLSPQKKLKISSDLMANLQEIDQSILRVTSNGSGRSIKKARARPQSPSNNYSINEADFSAAAVARITSLKGDYKTPKKNLEKGGKRISFSCD